MWRFSGPTSRWSETPNVNEVTYKEDYLTSDENTITVLAMAGIEKQDFIRISRGSEEYAGVVTEIGYGTDRSKRLQTISYKPLVELLNTGILFDVNAQGQGTLEEFICDRIRETFIDNPDTLQNIHGLSVAHTSATPDWSLHITPAESGGHYNIVNLMDSVIVPAMQKYGIVPDIVCLAKAFGGGMRWGLSFRVTKSWTPCRPIRCWATSPRSAAIRSAVRPGWRRSTICWSIASWRRRSARVRSTRSCSAIIRPYAESAAQDCFWRSNWGLRSRSTASWSSSRTPAS